VQILLLCSEFPNSSPISVPSTRSSLPTCRSAPARRAAHSQKPACKGGEWCGRQQQLLLPHALLAVPPLLLRELIPHLIDLIGVIGGVVAQQEAKQR
jgi:hypothetical protein